MSQERRLEPRVLLRRQAKVTLDGETTRSTYTANLSRGGLLIELDDAPPAGAALQLELALTEGAPLAVHGTVRHTTRVSTQGPGGFESRYLVGVRFESLPAAALRLIEDTLEAEKEEEEEDRDV